MRAWTLAVVLSSSLLGCTPDYPPPNPDTPSPPTSNDPAFAIDGLKDWYVMPDAAQPGTNQMTFIVKAPSGSDYVDAYIPGLGGHRLHEQSDGFALDINIEGVEVGTHDILFTANGSTTAFAKATFHRSMAYYVLVSTDYDFSDPGKQAIIYMDSLHTNHPGMLITHFWAPYTYTDPVVTPARRDELDVWIKKQRDEMHDEIALHIHPWCHFVTSAGLTCITNQSTVYPDDMSGYTIKLAAYGRQDMGTLLQRAHAIFNERGLGTPVTFRAGGWTADVQTLLALDDNGYVADTSALNWAKIEEWNGKELYTWNQTNWSQIGDTSQPYHPSTSDPQASVPGANMRMLEVPDNGVMIDYVSLEEMNGLFDANWDGQPLAAPKTLMMGFHPAGGFSPSEYGRVDNFLKYADMHLGSAGTGPVVYATLSQVSAVFPP
ncbi:MAG TPA: hypothetical protein VMZ53_22025 [Kofleriaceae bacterium]|nr:hypothetical protein [Kofleriaceae bacterium]